jgi:hypothetical protein
MQPSVASTRRLWPRDARNCGIGKSRTVHRFTADGPTGEPGGNSTYRLAGVLGAFEVPPDLAASIRDAAGPVLLVDDLADSRWTLTVTARALRRAGAASVLPFALALRG